MRLWSIHPKYLDKTGLGACWREGLLAQSCLIKGAHSPCSTCCDNTFVDEKNLCVICKGKRKQTPYYNHPQLTRFKIHPHLSRLRLSIYLYHICKEAEARGYKYNFNLINTEFDVTQFVNAGMNVTNAQVQYEFNHLQKKLMNRDQQKYIENSGEEFIDPNPIFKVVSGEIERWENQSKDIHVIHVKQPRDM